MKKRLKKKKSKLSYRIRYSKPLYSSLESLVSDVSKKLEDIAVSRGKSIPELFDQIESSAYWSEEDRVFHSLYQRLGTAKAMQEKGIIK